MPGWIAQNSERTVAQRPEVLGRVVDAAGIRPVPHRRRENQFLNLVRMAMGEKRRNPSTERLAFDRIAGQAERACDAARMLDKLWQNLGTKWLVSE